MWTASTLSRGSQNNDLSNLFTEAVWLNEESLRRDDLVRTSEH